MLFSRKAGVDASGKQRDALQLGIARYLAWVLLILILCFAVLLAVIFGNRARETLLTKQRSFAGILAEHLNQQIFVRFSIPVVANYGRQNLKQNAQYVLLDKTVEDLTRGLQVHSVRIFDVGGEIKYSSLNRDEVGYKSPETELVASAAVEGGDPLFTVDRNVPLWESYVNFFRLKPGAFYLRTTAPMRPIYSLRVENSATYELTTGPSLGVLEFTQDITTDMADIVRFQLTIVGVTLASSLLLFFLLMVFLRRAQYALSLRMEEQQRLQRELHQHEKLAGMGRVVAGIAHEIRNPLGIIQSSAELLLSRPVAKEDAVTGKILRAIFDEARRLSQTVSDFLDYARPRQPQQDPVNLSQTVQDVLTFLEPEIAARGVTVTVSFPPQGEEGSLCTLGDKDLLYRAFYNILMNGIQAMDGAADMGCMLSIKGRPSPEDPTAIELFFTDSGPGFPVEDRERILDPFMTTKDGGTGLGLPIVNNIITSHGGVMFLEDAPRTDASGTDDRKGGAQVRVVLPGVPRT